MTPEVEELIEAVLEMMVFCEDKKLQLLDGHLEEINRALNAIMLVEHRKMIAEECPTIH